MTIYTGWTESDEQAAARLAKREALHKKLMAERQAAEQQNNKMPNVWMAATEGTK